MGEGGTQKGKCPDFWASEKSNFPGPTIRFFGVQRNEVFVISFQYILQFGPLFSPKWGCSTLAFVEGGAGFGVRRSSVWRYRALCVRRATATPRKYQPTHAFMAPPRTHPPNSRPPHSQTSDKFMMATTVELCWTGMFSDPHRGIEAYTVTVTESGAPVASFQDVTAECVTLAHGLASGAVVDVAIAATNPSGGTTTNTASLTVDLSPPEPPAAFYYGSAEAPVAAQTRNRSFRAEWAPFTDPESAPVATKVCLGRAQGACDLREDAAGAATAVHYEGLPPLPAAVWLTLKACNAAGLCRTWEPAEALVVDTVAPAVAVTVAGPTQCAEGSACDTVWVTDAAALTATLTFTDEASGLEGCSWGIGATSGGDAHMSFRPAVQGVGEISLVTTITATGLALPEGVPLFVTVQCRDRAGLGAAHSVPIAVLAHAPGTADVVLRLSAAVARSAASDVTVTWSGFHVLRPSLVQYAVAVGSAIGLQDLSAWTTAQDYVHAIDVSAFPEGEVCLSPSSPPPILCRAPQCLTVIALLSVGVSLSLCCREFLQVAFFVPLRDPRPLLPCPSGATDGGWRATEAGWCNRQRLDGIRWRLGVTDSDCRETDGGCGGNRRRLEGNQRRLEGLRHPRLR